MVIVSPLTSLDGSLIAGIATHSFHSGANKMIRRDKERIGATCIRIGSGNILVAIASVINADKSCCEITICSNFFSYSLKTPASLFVSFEPCSYRLRFEEQCARKACAFSLAHILIQTKKV
uniref:Uncharacterized protein n=1 Tax=Chaetoceros debilis TaxID=122233 RepID=A0A6S8XEU0_9STRA